MLSDIQKIHMFQRSVETREISIDYVSRRTVPHMEKKESDFTLIA